MESTLSIASVQADPGNVGGGATGSVSVQLPVVVVSFGGGVE